MDTQRDFKPFQELMDELSAALRQGFNASDALVRSYWDALKDAHFSEVRANAKRILATATKDTPFPRPRELRNRAPAMDEQSDPRRVAADRRCAHNWQALKAEDGVRYRIEYGIARAARELAQLDPEDPGYDEWTQEYRRWLAVRYAPRDEQEKALARYAG